jgi:hypothetical protein
MPRIQLLNQIGAQYKQENTWDAINVIQAVGEMSFGSCQLVDETTGERWVARAGEPSPFPINIPFGHLVGTSFLCSNTGDVPVKVFVYIAIIDPSGTKRAEAWNPSGSIPQTVNPGVGYYSQYIGGVQLDRTGLWKIYGRLEYDVA